MKNKKDIVELIIEKMKSQQELPYKEGAWENFQDKYGSAPIKRNRTFYWAASAAAILLLGIVTVNHWPETNQPLVDNNGIANQDTKAIEDQATDNLDPVPNQLNKQENINETNGYSIENNSLFVKPGINDQSIAQISSSAAERASYPNLRAIPNYSNANIYPNSVLIPNSLDTYQLSNKRAKIDLNNSDQFGMTENNLNNELAYQAQGAQKGQEPIIKDRRFNLREKFDLGLFVSPNSTNDRFNFGGGVLLAYNITKHVSVRTGLAYNKYDASEMKDPVANAETPVVANKDALQKITANGVTQQFMSSNALILPNVNAISGNVQALEIPLDIRVKSKQGYYASSGITYAAVFNQNRYAHFVENANTELFGNGLPENEAEVKTAVKQVSRAIKTEDENISSRGFGGFVNFSIGREMKMNKNIHLSVEPYLKLPVGSFKRADMNYTNGGIRIITNF